MCVSTRGQTESATLASARCVHSAVLLELMVSYAPIALQLTSLTTPAAFMRRKTTNGQHRVVFDSAKLTSMSLDGSAIAPAAGLEGTEIFAIAFGILSQLIARCPQDKIVR